MFKHAITILAGLLCAGSAHATLVERDWTWRGDNLLTYDTQSGREWLDIWVGTNKKRVDIERQLMPGQRFSGFRLANKTAVAELFEHAGLTGLMNRRSSTPANLEAANLLVRMLGTNYSSGDYTFLAGMMNGMADEPNYGYWLPVASVELNAKGVRNCTADSGCMSYTTEARADADQRTWQYGAFLYRDAAEVPVPGTAALMGLGLLTLALRRPRARQAGAT